MVISLMEWLILESLDHCMVKTLKNYYKLFEGDNLNFEKIFLNYPTKNDRRKNSI